MISYICPVMIETDMKNMKKELWRIGVIVPADDTPYGGDVIKVENLWGTEAEAYEYYNSFPKYDREFITKVDVKDLITMLTNLDDNTKTGMIDL